MKVDLMKESTHMFNWEKIWSDIKNYICFVIVVVVLVGGVIYFVFPNLLQALIDVPLPYFEK